MKSIITRILLGLGIGVVFAALGFFTRLKASFLSDTYPADLSALEWLWIGINFPARLLFRVWVLGFRLPPQNDFLVVLVLPSIAVLLQWIFIGILIGLWSAQKAKGMGSALNP